jgi:hypothetical protein
MTFLFRAPINDLQFTFADVPCKVKRNNALYGGHVCLSVTWYVRKPSDRYFLKSDIGDEIVVTVRQLQVCSCGAPSPTRGRICHLQLLLVLSSIVILESESRGADDHILLSQIRYSPNLEGHPCTYIPQGQGGPVIPPGTGFPYLF